MAYAEEKETIRQIEKLPGYKSKDIRPFADYYKPGVRARFATQFRFNPDMLKSICGTGSWLVEN